MSNPGFDYGLGTTNIDPETGIRYGVIPMNALCGHAMDSFEPQYGEPTCPKCGGEVVEHNEERHSGYKVFYFDCRDFACESCGKVFSSEEVYPEEPICWTCEEGGYKLFVNEHNNVWILKSEYYTVCGFCSPVAPGAGYLLSPCGDGPRAFCLSHDFFEHGEAPYPVYLIGDGKK
jgi:hypothetical protein